VFNLSSYEKCRNELREVLEEWLILKRCNNDTLEAFHESENSNLEGYSNADSLFKSLF